MRLIDADKLRAEYKDPEDIRDSAKVLYHVTGIWAGIDAAETVEAIPVPWIKAQMEKLKSDGCIAEIGALGIKAMLIQWRKEQEGEGA